MSHFFAYMARMKFIRRWGLMRNTRTENIQEHSLQVSMIAHALAVIRNERFGGSVDAARVALLGVFHDAEEVITGDLPTPIKYFNPQIRDAFSELSVVAQERLLGMLPEFMRKEYEPLISDAAQGAEEGAGQSRRPHLRLPEMPGRGQGGKQGVQQSRAAGVAVLEQMNMPEVTYFMETFVPSFRLTLDELNERGVYDGSTHAHGYAKLWTC